MQLNWKSVLTQLRKYAGALAPAFPLLFLSPVISPLADSAANSVCACCADPGVWSLETRKLDNEMIKELSRVKPNGVAEFYVTDAWPEDVSGIALPAMYEPGPLVASIVREARTWKFFFKTSSGETGALVLTLPGTATFFNADIEERPKQENAPLSAIYNEVRLEGMVRGTGIFAKGNAPTTKFRLVLQGKGNRCLNAEHLHRWNLRISGPQAKYALYGFFNKLSN